MHISSLGLEYIKAYEGYREHVYRCPAGLLTIGYGHALKPYENFKTVTKTQAEELLRQDIQNAEICIRQHVSTPLTQNQYDALVSFVYNIGVGNFLKSTVLKALNKRDFKKATSVMKQFHLCKRKPLLGLIKRREAEVELFLKR